MKNIGTQPKGKFVPEGYVELVFPSKRKNIGKWSS